jgi:hypothetical protein
MSGAAVLPRKAGAMGMTLALWLLFLVLEFPDIYLKSSKDKGCACGLIAIVDEPAFE